MENKLNSDVKFKVAFNLADDIKGGWTNYYTTYFDSKFKLNALVEHRFYTPYFWTSESINIDLIMHRAKENCFCIFYFLENGKSKTLWDHVTQELYVASQSYNITYELNVEEKE